MTGTDPLATAVPRRSSFSDPGEPGGGNCVDENTATQLPSDPRGSVGDVRDRMVGPQQIVRIILGSEPSEPTVVRLLECGTDVVFFDRAEAEVQRRAENVVRERRQQSPAWEVCLVRCCRVNSCEQAQCVRRAAMSDRVGCVWFSGECSAEVAYADHVRAAARRSDLSH